LRQFSVARPDGVFNGLRILVYAYIAGQIATKILWRTSLIWLATVIRTRQWRSAIFRAPQRS
jgi:hypothetical protein